MFGYFTEYMYNVKYFEGQNVYVEDRVYLNQFWNYDIYGNIVRSQSNYFSIESEKDSLKINEVANLKVVFDCPMFKEHMRVITGEGISKNFTITDSTKLDTTYANNHIADLKVKFSKAGEYYFKGIIQDYKYELDTIINKKQLVLRNNYFYKIYFVD
jgi:hypothetical protein